jgi:CBS domain containing-hemolysin-like protein
MTVYSYRPYLKINAVFDISALSDFQLMIYRSKIDLREHTRTTELIEQIINPRQRVLVLDSYLIQGTIIHAQPLSTILLQDKNRRAPHGDELGQINPFSSNSLMCSFNSANSGVAIL